MKIAVEDDKRCNIPSVRKRLKMELMRRKSFDSTLSNKIVTGTIPANMRRVLHTRMDKAIVQS
ncbi:hypothetical protein E2C01_063363 [Portunus trituberculatus]|uniref:Uncharacterized protein n=1 Tax=Portunus trituberculatus TaxID=210409 RepID=A0A5B7HK88_PORTR|nr:hypothetical protein [Portunus trituberculatus]